MAENNANGKKPAVLGIAARCQGCHQIVSVKVPATAIPRDDMKSLFCLNCGALVASIWRE